MKTSRMRLLAVAAVIGGLPLPLAAQTVPYAPYAAPGAAQAPYFPSFGTTGQPSGSFALPNVPIRRRPPLAPADPSSTQTRTAGTDTQNGQSPAPTPVPATPENPNALTTGRSIDVQDRTKDQAPSSAETARTADPAKPAIAAGMAILGKAKVFDGHSLLVEGTPVRLDGVDAPGLLQTCTDPSGTAWRCGERAYRRLKELADGRNVDCRAVAPSGTGAAAICSANGSTDIARLMVLEGMAVPNGHDRGRYAREAAAARASGAGVWGGSFEAPWRWRARQD